MALSCGICGSSVDCRCERCGFIVDVQSFKKAVFGEEVFKDGNFVKERC